MCTVSYLPKPGGGFILTSNRDEKLIRKKALPPAFYYHYEIETLYPKDDQAKGTWVTTAGNGYTLCLLNGAFEKHISEPPYKMSRGLMLLSFFQFNGVLDFVKSFDFEGIEPFTLIVATRNNYAELNELRWDGTTLHNTVKDPSVGHIWSSATLYNSAIIAEREKWFEAWMRKNIRFTIQDIIEFHLFGGKGDTQNDLVMNRNDLLATQSITSISVSPTSPSLMWYTDLLTNKEYKDILNFAKADVHEY